MRRTELLKRIAKLAKKDGATWELHHEGSKHSIFQINGQNIPIPRHNEINEITARSILSDVQDEIKRSRDENV